MTGGKEHVEDFQELPVVELHAHALLHAEALADRLELAAAQHYMHVAHRDAAQELILRDRAALFTIEVLEHLAQIGDLVRFAGQLHQGLRADGSLVEAQEAVDAVQIGQMEQWHGGHHLVTHVRVQLDEDLVEGLAEIAIANAGHAIR